MRCQYPWITRKTCRGPVWILLPLTEAEEAATVEAWRACEMSVPMDHMKNMLRCGSDILSINGGGGGGYGGSLEKNRIVLYPWITSRRSWAPFRSPFVS